MDLESNPSPLPPSDGEEKEDSYNSDSSTSEDSSFQPLPVFKPLETIRDNYGFDEKEIIRIGKNLKTDKTVEKLVLNGSRNIGPLAAYHLGRGLKTNTTLLVLFLRDCNLDEKLLRLLANGLRSNNHLQVLDMKENVDITPLGAQALFRALAMGGGNLLTLNYSGNSLFEDRGYKKALFWLSLLLCRTKTLIKLNLADTMLQSLGPPLSFGLLANTTLENLNLKWSSFEDEPNRFFWQEWLSLNGTLQFLNLAQCGIDEELVVYLARGLELNTSLTYLDLSSNEFMAKGAMLIAEAVRRNKQLKVVNLANNQLDDSVGAAIAKMLEDNTTLTSLSLSNNPLGAALKAIAGAMKTNETLKTLVVQSCEFKHNGWLKFMEMLLWNKSLLGLHMGGAYTRTESEGIERIDLINLTSILPFIRNCEAINKADQKEFILAMFMSTHKRLGANSWLQLLDESLISNIWTCAIVLCKAWNYCPAYHYFLHNSILK